MQTRHQEDTFHLRQCHWHRQRSQKLHCLALFVMASIILSGTAVFSNASAFARAESVISKRFVSARRSLVVQGSQFSRYSFISKANYRSTFRKREIDGIIDRLRGGDSGIEENPDYEPKSSRHYGSKDKIKKRNKREEESSTLHASKHSKSSKTSKANSNDPSVLSLFSSLLTSSKSFNKRNKRILKQLTNILKSSKYFILPLLILLAFHREIFHMATIVIYKIFIQCKIIPTEIDKLTGKRRLVLNWTTFINFLKVALVLEGVRRWCILTSLDDYGDANESSSEEEYDEIIDDDDEVDGIYRSENRLNQTKHDTAFSHGTSKKTTRKLKSHRVIILPSLLPLLILLSILFLPSLRRNMFFFLPIISSFLFRTIGTGGPLGSPDGGGGPHHNPITDLIIASLTGEQRGGEHAAIRQAYVPPLEQHYTFEQVNERYFRDWAAWRKAFPVNGAVVSPFGHFGTSGGLDGNSSILSSLVRSHKLSKSHTHSKGNDGKSNTAASTHNYPTSYNNGTVIILDLGKLDTEASQMQGIRDQISFLIHLVRSEDPSYFSPKASDVDGRVLNHDSSKGPHHNQTHNLDATNASTATNSSFPHSTNGNLTAPIDPPSNIKSEQPQLEVIALLSSPGGSVSTYGLASSHLHRLRSTPGVTLTICIDTIAASGGYMMACMSTPGQLYCAPYAMVGSIGVIGQSINVQKMLERYGVKPYVFRGGKMKNPVGMVGDVTKDGVAAMQDMVERIHGSFRSHVAEARDEALREKLLSDGDGKSRGQEGKDVMDVIDKVATGDVFLGVQALELGLVDRLITSDEYIEERIQQGARVLKLIVHTKPLGLSGLLMGRPARPGTPFAAKTILKKAVYRIVSAVAAWAEPGIEVRDNMLNSE